MARGLLGMAGAPGVDVQSTSAGVSGLHAQTGRSAACPDIHEDALHTLLMELVVIPEAHEIAQQPGLVNYIRTIK